MTREAAAKVELGNTFQPKWVRFVLTDTPGRKTKVWLVQTKDGEDLGEIKFWPRWRKYSFFPLPNTLYEQDCLWDIADFCARKTQEWKTA
jgi:hypothetical protein